MRCVYFFKGWVEGWVGVWWVGGWVGCMCMVLVPDEYIHEYIHIYMCILYTHIHCTQPQFLYGRAGYLFGALLLNQTLGSNTIPHQDVQYVIDALLRSGVFCYYSLHTHSVVITHACLHHTCDGVAVADVLCTCCQ